MMEKLLTYNHLKMKRAMRKIGWTALVWLWVGVVGGMAQDLRYEEMMRHKRGFFQRKLELSEDAMNKFWPEYEAMDGELRKLAAERKKLTIDLRQKMRSKASDAELEKLMDRYLEIDAERVAVKRRYYERFKKVLPIRKVIRIPVAERQFRKKMLERLRRRDRPMRPPMRGPDRRMERRGWE